MQERLLRPLWAKVFSFNVNVIAFRAPEYAFFSGRNARGKVAAINWESSKKIIGDSDVNYRDMGFVYDKTAKHASLFKKR